MKRALASLLLLAGCATQLNLTDDAGTQLPPVQGGNSDLAAASDLARPSDLSSNSCLSASASVDVVCGASTCSVQDGEVCCLGGSAGLLCSTGACRPGDNLLFCDGPEDCSTGEKCCYQLGAGSVSTASCNGMCSGRVICHSASDCEMGSVCRHERGFPDSVGLCRNSC